MKTKGKRLEGVAFTNADPRYAGKLNDPQGDDATMLMQVIDFEKNMKSINSTLYNVILKGEKWTYNMPPCSKGATALLANNESIVTWISQKDNVNDCLEHIPVIFYQGKYWTLSLRMSKCISRHVRLRKGFENRQTVHGIVTLQIPQLLLNEKKRTQARFEVCLMLIRY